MVISSPLHSLPHPIFSHTYTDQLSVSPPPPLDLHSSSEGSGVLLVAATTRPDSLDPAVRRSGRFDREICLGIPDEPARLSILQVLMRGLRLEPDFPLQDLAHRTPGYVGADLRALIREASLCAVNRLLSTSGRHALSTPVGGASPGSEVTGSTVTPEEGTAPGPLTENRNPSFENRDPQSLEGLDDIFITAKDFELALQEVQPSAKREGFATVPGTSWDDVGALEDVREELTLAILAPVRYPRQFADLGLTTPPGILLAGPPGCGKTLLAKAIANESGINFISVKGPELLNMYVGESERAVRQVFQRARNSAPCVIFFDELDALCPRRSEMAEASASSRVVNQLLTEMDGLQARRQVFIMAATNRPDIIDPAVLRPGRLDRVVYVGLPSSRDRSLILNTITKNGTRPRTRNVDMSTLASSEYTEGFSGADLKSLVREAAIAALKQHMHLSSNWLTPDQSDRTSSLLPAVTKVGGASEGAKVDGEECVVTMENFVSALKRVKPSVSGKDRLFYESMRDQFSCSKTS
jgi:ribosome biogenesis ATPase